MAVTSKSQARLFAQLIADLEPEIRRAFMASVADLKSGVDWATLLERLVASDIEGAIESLNISPAAWAEYSMAMTAAYSKAGIASMVQIKTATNVNVRFDMTNPRAQEWIRSHVAESVVGFNREQVIGARAVIEAGYARGDGPRTIAIDLAGRAQGGVRQGGILGLDNPRAARLQNVSIGMRTPEGVRSLVIKGQDGSLSLRYKVNSATEQRILSAYRSGTSVPPAERLISERQYQNALLKARADTVAETETANAVMSSRAESWVQVAESQGLTDDAVIKTWRHRRGSSKYHRPDHLAMSGKSVRGLNTPFVFPDGSRLEFAHDPNGGASHTIKCGCDTEFRIDQSAGLT